MNNPDNPQIIRIICDHTTIGLFFSLVDYTDFCELFALFAIIAIIAIYLDYSYYLHYLQTYTL